MKVLVTGGRDYSKHDYLFGALDALDMQTRIHTIIHGAASGADTLAGYWGRRREREVKEFPADWQNHGRVAGVLRNQRMLDEGNPDLVVAFPGGVGTSDMVRRSRAAGVKVLDLRRI